MVKCGVRDLAVVAARGGDGGDHGGRARRTSPRRRASRVFATGGLGGVHREARETWDESADLVTLARDADRRGLRRA